MPIPKHSDSFRPVIDKMIPEFAADAGTDIRGAVRDMLTDIIHYCRANGLDPKDRFDAAYEVAEEEMISMSKTHS